MDIDVVYKAKDGRRFSDPFECEEYEKRLGTEPGTVGRARIDLKALGEDRYAFGLLKVRHENANYYRTYVVQCIDDKLEDYVNVSDLDVDKRWVRNTIGDVLRDMEHFNDDDICEYEFIYCDHWEFGGEHPFCCYRSYNQKFWEESREAEKTGGTNAKK